MWRPIFRQEHLKAGDRLRKELLMGDEHMWAEYEVVAADEQGLVLKSLLGKTDTGTDAIPAYKNIKYDALYAGSARVWVAMVKPGCRV